MQLAILKNWRFPLPQILGILLIAIVINCLIHLLFGFDLGIERIIIPLLKEPHPPYTYMRPFGMIGFFFSGLIGLLWSKRQKPTCFFCILLLSLLIFFFGMLTVFGLWTPIYFPGSPRPFQNIPIHFYAAIAMMAIGIGLSSALLGEQRSIKRNRTLPLAVGIGFALFSVLLVIGSALGEATIEGLTAYIFSIGGAFLGIALGGLIYMWQLSQERLNIERELLQAQSRFQDFVQTTQEWIWEIDEKGSFTYSNPAIETILGYTPEEILGKTISLYVIPQEQELVETILLESKKTKSGWLHKTIHVKRKDGRISVLEGNSQPLFDENNKLIGFRGTARDISEAKRIEEQKDEFVSMVSHELRSPLASIYGALGLLSQKDSYDEKTKELLAIALRNAEKLSATITDILDIQKLELGKIKIKISQTDIAAVIESAISSSTPMAESMQIKLIREGEFPPTFVVGNSERLNQVMMNLLSNAIKFSHPGGSVFISMKPFDMSIKVFVRDEGKGMTDEFIPHVFEKFHQEDAGDNRQRLGTGLGLAICKTIVEQCGGQIGFVTEKNIGTTFYIVLTKWK